LKLRWSQRAQDDLVEIALYIAEDNPAAARSWVKRLRERARKAAASPLAGRYVPERHREHIREVFLRSYRIIYRIQGSEILILTVLEGHRLLRPDRFDEE
jgi:addiction module RelE/StbE family toxin